MLSGTLLADAVTWLFTSVLKGLQTHGQHDGCMASLVHLAFQIYEALVSGESLWAGWLQLDPSQAASVTWALINSTQAVAKLLVLPLRRGCGRAQTPAIEWVYPYFSAAQVPGDKSCDGADSRNSEGLSGPV